MSFYKTILTTLERWDLSSSEESGLKRELAKDIENAVKNNGVLANVRLSLPSDDLIDEIFDDMCLYATEESDKDDACRSGAKKIIEHLRARGNEA